MGQLITELIDDLLYAAKGSPMGKPTAIVMTRETRRELAVELSNRGLHGLGAASNYAGVPVVVEPHAVGVSLRYE